MLTSPADYPLFTEYTMADLIDKVGSYYSLGYLVLIRKGERPANPTFRRRIAELLNRTEAELFGEQEAALATLLTPAQLRSRMAKGQGAV